MAHVRTEIRRQQFIDAAVVVVGREGVDGATTRRIAEEAGAPLATLHYCFGTKEALLWAVFEQLADLVQVEIEAVAEPGRTVAVAAGHLLRQTIRWGVSHRDHNKAQLEIWLWAQRSDQDFAIRIYDRYIETCKDILRAASEPLDEQELQNVISVIVALVDGLAMQLATDGDEQAVLRDTETAVAMLSSYLAWSRPAAGSGPAGSARAEELRQPA